MARSVQGVRPSASLQGQQEHLAWPTNGRRYFTIVCTLQGLGADSQGLVWLAGDTVRSAGPRGRGAGPLEAGTRQRPAGLKALRGALSCSAFHCVYICMSCAAKNTAPWFRTTASPVDILLALARRRRRVVRGRHGACSRDRSFILSPCFSLCSYALCRSFVRLPAAALPRTAASFAVNQASCDLAPRPWPPMLCFC